MTEQAGMTVTLLTRIRQVTDLRLGHDTGCNDFSWLSSALQGEL